MSRVVKRLVDEIENRLWVRLKSIADCGICEELPAFVVEELVHGHKVIREGTSETPVI